MDSLHLTIFILKCEHSQFAKQDSFGNIQFSICET